MMEILIYSLFFLFTLLFIIIFILYLLFTLDSLITGHDLPTSKNAVRVISKIISKYKPEAKNFYDLGCGRGTLALAIKKNFPDFEVYGIDKSPFRILFAKLKAYFLGRKINFKKSDLFNENLKSADIVYTYLWYDLMPPLEEKLKKELKNGAVIITNTSYFPNWQPSETYITYPKKLDFEKLFVYIKN